MELALLVLEVSDARALRLLFGERAGLFCPVLAEVDGLGASVAGPGASADVEEA